MQNKLRISDNPGTYLEGGETDDVPLDPVGNHLCGVLDLFRAVNVPQRHYWMFWLGFFGPFLWIIGALIGPTPRAAGAA